MDHTTTRPSGYAEKPNGQERTDTSFLNDMKDIKDSISTTAKHASDKAGNLYNDIKDQTVDIQRSTVTYIKVNPVKSVGFALLAGFITAYLFRK